MATIIEENAAEPKASEKKKVPLKDGLAKSEENPGTALGTAGTPRSRTPSGCLGTKGATATTALPPSPRLLSCLFGRPQLLAR
jgi:hypothetical protein